MIDDAKIKAANARLKQMMKTEDIEEAIQQHVLTYLESTDGTLEQSLSEGIENLKGQCEDPNDTFTLTYQAIIQAVSTVLAQNTRDLVTLIATRAAKNQP
jgi:hypothetical protein